MVQFHSARPDLAGGRGPVLAALLRPDCKQTITVEESFLVVCRYFGRKACSYEL